ncbi:MAG TPA: hypothetical protein VER33_28515 [Polyangiaceae bacterium]|nr:hypothetical protein [Polyangiaceae bacterium]
MKQALQVRSFVAALALIGASGCIATTEEEGGIAEPVATGDTDAGGVEFDENDTAGIEMHLGTGPDAAGTTPKQSSVCARSPFGPGWVNWGMSNPWGAGFSVKPETSWSLIAATPPGQACDGVYRRSWGCNVALKVPDSCTASVSSTGSVSCCCNATAAALGHVCKWVNPTARDIGWPACPL